MKKVITIVTLLLFTYVSEADAGRSYPEMKINNTYPIENYIKNQLSDPLYPFIKSFPNQRIFKHYGSSYGVSVKLKDISFRLNPAGYSIDRDDIASFSIQGIGDRKVRILVDAPGARLSTRLKTYAYFLGYDIHHSIYPTASGFNAHVEIQFNKDLSVNSVDIISADIGSVSLDLPSEIRTALDRSGYTSSYITRLVNDEIDNLIQSSGVQDRLERYITRHFDEYLVLLAHSSVTDDAFSLNVSQKDFSTQLDTPTISNKVKIDVDSTRSNHSCADGLVKKSYPKTITAYEPLDSNIYGIFPKETFNQIFYKLGKNGLFCLPGLATRKEVREIFFMGDSTEEVVSEKEFTGSFSPNGKMKVKSTTYSDSFAEFDALNIEVPALFNGISFDGEEFQFNTTFNFIVAIETNCDNYLELVIKRVYTDEINIRGESTFSETYISKTSLINEVNSQLDDLFPPHYLKYHIRTDSFLSDYFSDSSLTSSSFEESETKDACEHCHINTGIKLKGLEQVHYGSKDITLGITGSTSEIKAGCPVTEDDEDGPTRIDWDPGHEPTGPHGDPTTPGGVLYDRDEETEDPTDDAFDSPLEVESFSL